MVARKTTKKRTPKKKKTNDTPMIYLLSLILLAILIVGIFQLGLIGLAVDCFFILISGSGRYYTYLLAALLLVYYTVNKHPVPLNRRVIGWMTLQFAISMFFAWILRMRHGVQAPNFDKIYELESDNHIHFQGGGWIGYYPELLLKNLLSSAGSLIVILLLFGLCGILIAGRSVRSESKMIFKYLHQFILHLKERLKRHHEEISAPPVDKKTNVKVSANEEPVDVTEFEEVPIIEPQQIKTQSIENEIDKHEDISNVEDIVVEDVSTDDDYQLPPITLLDAKDGKVKMDTKRIRERGQLLESTLKNFGVNAKVSQIKIGPAVTQYEVQPAMGVKVSRIVNLSNDIALALAAKDIRIEAPIPGKSAVGIEVPNSKVAMVSLKEVLEEGTYSDNKLKVALGRNISGETVTAELDKMPHLLVAGSTGSGKSVCINGIITSLLMNAKPHEVRLMMIDPKMVELTVYNGIPHLLTPVVTNPQKAAAALQKIVGEMERRYDHFSHVGSRNIEGYNQYLARQNQELNEKNALLPYIVVIVDELADLMMVASKDVESAIMRIAQMGRAAGIHLIVATQRPSVDVITGLIKANIPSRIAFAVSSQIDSRTILDAAGAEKLLGKGDMLYLPRDQSKPTRIQGAFLSDAEVEKVVHYVTQQQSANYIKEMEPEVVEKSNSSSEDELYMDAYQFVIEQKKASASLLQRQFRIGYNRAARLIDELEANQVIGPASGSKPRQVLIDDMEQKED